MSNEWIFRDQVFADIARPVDCSQPGEHIDLLVVENCLFDHCERAVAGWHRGASLGAVVIDNCRFRNCDYGVKLGNRFESCRVTNCHFEDVGQTAIEVGSQQCVMETYPNADVSNNQIQRVAAKTLALGIWTYGVGHRVCHNVIQDVSIESNPPGQDDDAVAIYCKTSRSVISENIIVDGGCYEGAICLKGHGVGNRVANNTIRVTRDPQSPRWDRAITIIANDENTIEDNQIDERLRIVISTATAGNRVRGYYELDRHVDPDGHTTAYIFWPR